MTSLNETDLPFTIVFNSIWYSLDDFFISIGIILVSVPIITAIGDATQHYFRYSLWLSQAITFVLIATVFLFLLGQAAGEESTVSMLQGFALGVGYALQPYIVSLLSGATYFSTGMVVAGDQILIEKEEYKIISNGVLYIEAENITKNLIVYVPNGYFQNVILKKKKSM